MLQVGTKVRVVHEDSSHNAKIGDVGMIEDIIFINGEKLHIVIFEGKTFPNGNSFQALEDHEIEVVE